MKKFSEDSIDFLFKIEQVDEKTIYAYKTKAEKNKQIFLFRIRILYKHLKKIKIYPKIYETGMYGVSIVNDNKEIVYYVGCEKDFGNSEKIIIKSGKYLVFDCNGDDQIDIAPLISKIYSQLEKTIDIKIDKSYCFERYKNNNCFVYIKIKD